MGTHGSLFARPDLQVEADNAEAARQFAEHMENVLPGHSNPITGNYDRKTLAHMTDTDLNAAYRYLKGALDQELGYGVTFWDKSCLHLSRAGRCIPNLLSMHHESNSHIYYVICFTHCFIIDILH